MSRALRSGMGPYSQIRERVESVLQNPGSRDQDTSSIDTNHPYGGQVSDSSGDSVVTIHQQSQDAAPAAHSHRSDHVKMSEKSPDLQEHNQEKRLHANPPTEHSASTALHSWGAGTTLVSSRLGDTVIPITRSPASSVFPPERKRWWSRSRKEKDEHSQESVLDPSK